MKISERLGKNVTFASTPLPNSLRLNSAVERILSRWPDVVSNPPEKDREQLVQEVKRKLEVDDWNDTKTSLVTSAARALFDEHRRDRDDLADLRQFFYEEIAASRKKTFLAAMFSVYMSSYVPGSIHTIRLADAFSVTQGSLGARVEQLLEKIPEILNPRIAPIAVAKAMYSMENPWLGLKAMGLRTPHAPGLMDFAHIEFINILQPSLFRQESVERLAKWIKPERQEAKSSGSGEAISAILGHWKDTQPDSELLRFLTETLVGLFGDPRVSRGRGWGSVPEALLDIMMRWLTGENIRFFLEVVSATESSHMWEPRRKFWWSLHEQKRIDAAWVAFSPDAVRFARNRLSKTEGNPVMAFGRQTAGGSRSDTSLLVLKIGRKIIVEGSHNYRIHIFREGSPGTPALFQPSYHCEMLRTVPGVLAKSHNGNWQGWVLEQI